jgi:hypothetical protein
VQDSPFSSERWKLLLLSVTLWVAAIGCATVRPEEKEFLAEPAMTWSSGGIAQTQEEHVLDNREGSQGGANAKGGGCGCN